MAVETAPILSHLSACRIADDELLIDGLRVSDETLVRLVRARHELGERPDELVRDALEIGARILDREQLSADTDVVRMEFERTARALDKDFGAHAQEVVRTIETRMEAAFGAENGQVTKALARHFGDDSSTAVQHRMRQVLTEVATGMRDDLRKQFSSENEHNPLAGFQRATMHTMKQSDERQHLALTALTEKVGELRTEVTELRSEKVRRDDVAAEAERGSAKGRSYEEAVYDALEPLANARGDCAEAVGDAAGTSSRKGDVLIDLEASSGMPRGRIVVEAKDVKNLSRNNALRYLDEARVARDADYAVLVCPTDGLPARTQTLREYNGDKLFVAFDPEDGPLGLEVAYGLARARVMMRRSGAAAAGVDVGAINSEVERAQQALEHVRRIKSQLTTATDNISTARELVESMASTVRSHLAEIDTLLATAPAET